VNIKERKVFALKNFRGLDKENKLLKVSPFRAADGYNFFIDSETLKTRPSFTYKEEPNFFLEDEDYIIDWYNFNGVKLYITKKHIYIQNGSFVINEKTLSNILLKSSFPTLNFEGMQPLFREEKECLFIFCLDYIFVFSLVMNSSTNNVEKYVLYEFRSKPNNPYMVSSEYHKSIDDLPTPYEPTLFIGLNRFEDVNLISRVSKYRIFAETRDKEEDSKINYTLPTHYDEEKHGSLQYIKDNLHVDFYKGKFGDTGVIPVFLGRNGENFNLNETHGIVINDGSGVEPNQKPNPIEIQDIFHPIRAFEYFQSNDETPVITPISEILDLKKSDFFRFTVKGTNQSVFEYLLNYIKNNEAELVNWVANRVYVFSMPVQYKAIYRDPVTNFAELETIQNDDVLVFVQLRKYQNLNYSLQEMQTQTSSKINETNFANPYPAYPTISGTFDHTIELSSNPIYFLNYTTFNFEGMVRTYVNENVNEFQHLDKIRVNAKFYMNSEILNERYATVNVYYQEWYFSTQKSITRDDYDHVSWPAFPAFSNPQNLPVVEPGILINTTGQNINWTNPTLINEMQAAILTTIDGLQDETGSGFAKLKVQTYYFDGNEPRDEGVSIVVDFTYAQGSVTPIQIRQSMSCVAVMNKQQTLVEPDLYEFEFNLDNNAFELKVKNYFYDYNNEPSIEVRVKFEENQDYEHISKSKFGVSFGSENRLFLAGNPKFKNIDRYNTSNDLLGDGVKNQSYELSYFPSKNYRVLGGKGAINGYVVATDTQLYVTKEDYPNDEKFFIRERLMTEQGQVSYRELKTSITKTPLNNKCIVRFYNDVLILAKDGLYGVEISSNVLTNERLVKLRSGFINKDLIQSIQNFDKNKIFILENNIYLYIFIGTTVYVADSRYTATNPNNLIENVSYEIVKWITHNTYRMGKINDLEITLLEESGDVFYHFEQKNVDDKIKRRQNAIAIADVPTLIEEGSPTTEVLHNAFFMPQIYDYILEKPLDYSIMLYHGFKLMGKSDVNYHIENTNEVVIDDSLSFRDVVQGETLYFKEGNVFYPFVVNSFDEFTRLSFTFDDSVLGQRTSIYRNVAKTKLYISLIFEYNVAGDAQKEKAFRLSPYPQEASPLYLKQEVGETDFQYSERIKMNFIDNEDYFFTTTQMFNCLISEEKKIEIRWLSGITDFDNNLMEKTMFRVNFYATKQDRENILKFGYKTMRRLRRLEDNTEVSISRQVDLSNPMSFEEVNFNTFALNTFNEFGISLPLKENNFLYIQFVVIGQGQIELNAIEIIYKLNRMLKSIG
jgi:hypothetical protein